MLGDFPVMPMIPTKDQARARQFYEKTLGLKVLRDMAAGVEYGTGGKSLMVYETYVEIPAQHTLAVWDVNDLDSEMSALRAKGVVFEEYEFPEFKTVNGVGESEHGRACWFKDPDGNLLSIIQQS